MLNDSPFDKVSKAYIELTYADDEQEEPPVITKQVNNACQFVFRSLEKRKYLIKVFENQGKSPSFPKVLHEAIVDLSDEREINGGVKILKLDIENNKKNSSDNYTYSVNSLVLMMVVITLLIKPNFIFDVAELIKKFTKPKKRKEKIIKF
jgi:hypothetical protein